MTGQSLSTQMMFKMEKIKVTVEEIRQATRPNVYRNRKKYTRKTKHKKISDE